MKEKPEKKQWIVEFVMQEGDRTVCKCIMVEEKDLLNAVRKVELLLERTCPGCNKFIHNAGIAAHADEKMMEKIFPDPIDWDKEELEEWGWQ